MELKNTAGYGIIALYLPVAQLDSARDSDSRGRRFESCRVGQKKERKSRTFSLFLTKFALRASEIFGVNQNFTFKIFLPFHSLVLNILENMI